MKDLKFVLTTRIEFGNGHVSKAGALAKESGASKIMIVTDKGLVRSGIVEKVIHSIDEEELEYIVYDSIRPNPRDTDCVKASEICIEENVDFVMAVGGGSSIDSAKAVASLITNRGPIENILKPNKLATESTPLMAIPTTAGTGSEVTSFSVITLEKERKKTCIFDDKIRPDIALVDPELLLELPESIIASTGIDALTHAIEAYTCRLANPVTDAFAIHAIKLISENLRTFMYNRTRESAGEMMMGSMLAGLAFGFSDIASVHCLAEAIGGYYDTPHGIANAIFLPVVFEYNIAADVRRHKDVAVALGIDTAGKSDRETAQAGAEWIRQLTVDLGIPSLRNLGYIEPEKFPELADICMQNVSSPSNPRPVTKEIYAELFRRTYDE